MEKAGWGMGKGWESLYWRLVGFAIIEVDTVF